MTETASPSPRSGLGHRFQSRRAGQVDFRCWPGLPRGSVVVPQLLCGLGHHTALLPAASSLTWVARKTPGDPRTTSTDSRPFSPGFLAHLITEYDKHTAELGDQLKYYQKQMGEMKLQLENVIKENERLHSELKDVVEKQLEDLPFSSDTGNETFPDSETVRNLQEQLQLANQKKDHPFSTG
ncbi:Sodium channel and clathrin linker 1 [Fukomys damarensis]|uniref:Sodium channel and clathrin linker 1 n=1 Tax=Fukomys damarensis TaxID=885580 RepID=A0A091DZ22_FUKDA|nr:Sodium channel and clathrin linker 1 [Fukomys damarensis]